MDDNIFNNDQPREDENASAREDAPATGRMNYDSSPYFGYGANSSPTPPPSPEHAEKSFTPPAFHSSQNGGQNTLYPVPAPNGQGKKEKKKSSRPVTRGGLVTACITTAVAASILTATIFSFGSNVGRLINGNASASSETSLSDSSDTVSRTSIVTESTDEAVIEAVAERVSPSVVGIVVKTSSSGFFFGSTSSESQGSGIVYTEDGYIITNYHVISNAVESNGKVQVYLPSDQSTGIDAAVVGYDVSSDLAVLKIEKTGLTAIETGDSASLKVGQTAVAVGNPGGLQFMGSVSKGIISGLDRVLQLENTQEIHLIQTDAAINPGNSGGALVDSSGRLIGVNSAKMASTDYEGMGFAIPVNSVVEICQRIIQNKDTPAPYVGVEISTYYDSDTLKRMGYPAGVVVSSVAEESPAEKAGIQRGDIITEFNSVAVSSLSAFNSEKAKCSPGDSATLTVYRSGRSYTVEITLGTANS